MLPMRGSTSSSWGARGKTHYEDGLPVRPKKRRIKKEDVPQLAPPVIAHAPPPPAVRIPEPALKPNARIAPAEPDVPTADAVLDQPSAALLAFQAQQKDDEAAIEALLKSIGASW